jgi:hypothetical protein
MTSFFANGVFPIPAFEDEEKGQRIAWMKQQADRLDPMIPSPPSILDRKGELSRW